MNDPEIDILKEEIDGISKNIDSIIEKIEEFNPEHNDSSVEKD